MIFSVSVCVGQRVSEVYNWNREIRLCCVKLLCQPLKSLQQQGSRILTTAAVRIGQLAQGHELTGKAQRGKHKYDVFKRADLFQYKPGPGIPLPLSTLVPLFPPLSESVLEMLFLKMSSQGGIQRIW